MISARKRGVSRLAAAAVATGLFAGGALVGASSAVAEENTPQPGGATATLDGLKVFDKVTIRDGDKPSRINAGLFEMSVDDGGTLQTYCIDIHNPTQDRATYQEVGWDKSSLHDNEDAGKILWILENSYPQVNDLTALAKRAGVDNLTPQTAAAGTQVAIWRYSDHADVTADNPAAEKLADYLEQAAKNVEEPKSSLSLGPAAVSGKSGERLGPITVDTNAQTVTVSPGPEAKAQGVKLVNAEGEEVTSAKDGSELYLDVPKSAEPGSTTVTAQAATSVPVGRAFTGTGQHAKSQTQILAGSSESTVTATVTATWANQGPIPAVSAEKNCAEGGVDITATNKGDEPFTFSLAGEEHTVEAGGAKTVTVPVDEDQAYKITIEGPNGFEKTFSGVLDCQTAGEQSPSAEPSPATVGGGGDDSGDLAETGSSSNTPVIAGVAVALVVVGGAVVFLVRKRKPSSSGAASED